MNQRYTLDRIEGDTAVLLNGEGNGLTLSKQKLAPEAKEGMLLVFDAASGLYCPDEAATAARQKMLKNRVAALLHKGRT